MMMGTMVGMMMMGTMVVEIVICDDDDHHHQVDHDIYCIIKQLFCIVVS
jgi:hypothetical protein